jgi:hypothetical protein
MSEKKCGGEMRLQTLKILAPEEIETVGENCSQSCLWYAKTHGGQHFCHLFGANLHETPDGGAVISPQAVTAFPGNPLRCEACRTAQVLEN